MFSPADIIKFLQMVKNSQYNGTPTHLIYATMITSSGYYSLRFNGDTNFNSSHIGDLKEINFLYKQYFEKYRYDIERALLHFLKDVIKVDGINLYRIRDNGDIEKKTLNELGKIDSDDCE